MTLNLFAALFAALTLAWACVTLVQRRTERKLSRMEQRLMTLRNIREKHRSNGKPGCAKAHCAAESVQARLDALDGDAHLQQELSPHASETRNRPEHGRRNHGNAHTTRAPWEWHEARADAQITKAIAAQEKGDDAAAFQHRIEAAISREEASQARERQRRSEAAHGEDSTAAP